MARITVEDCLDRVDNRFQLVLIASQRARQLANGRDAHLPWDNEKPTVLALREIAEGHTSVEVLEEPAGPEPSEEFSEAEAEAEFKAEGEAAEEVGVAAGTDEAATEAPTAGEEAAEEPPAEGEA